MKSMELLEQDDDLHLDLALSIGGTFRNLPEKSNGSDEESGVTDVKNRGEIRRRQAKRKREEDRNNPPLKREKTLEGNLTNNVDLDKPDPALQIPYPYSSLQYVPFFNGYGYAFPCFVPYCAVSESPVGCRSVSDVGFSNKKSGSSGSSPVCSSSVISDNHQSSSSHEGGSINSCNSSRSMNHVKPKTSSEKFVEESSHVKKISSSSSSMENGKPPKPKIQSQNVASFDQMPCVSTTGIGPNGTKIITNGFLYRYSNMEVSILCVCHGQSFSPAEFVKHGGGGEVSHPLKHITVLPPNGSLPSSIR